MKKIIPSCLLLAVPSLLVGCHGQTSSDPPIIPIRNMVDQTSYGPQSPNTFYPDGRATREPVAGTVAKGEEQTNTRLYAGVEPNSTQQNPIWVKKFPIVLTNELLARGQDRYNIYCAPCHGNAADNDGLATVRANGSIRPAQLHDQEKINLPVGKIYDAVTHGVNNWNMPGFATQMSVQDRWAVVAYVRALQLSRHGTLEDVPNEVQVKNAWGVKK